MQLLTIDKPALERLFKGSDEGRKKLQNIQDILTVVIGLLMGICVFYGFEIPV
jgi:preprotein translocase subunit SecY